MSKRPMQEAVEAARMTLWRTQEQIGIDLAWALTREIKGSATDRDREKLAMAIEEFLR